MILGDSNTTAIDMRRLGKGTGMRKQVTCYHAKEVTNFIKKATLVNNPEKVVVHVGTNDIVHYNGNGEMVLEDVKEAVQEIRTRLPETQIYVSSIFGRKQVNDTLMKPIREVNLTLEQLCNEPSMTFINNDNVKNMYDEKHVDTVGFRVFLQNLRETVFR